MKYYFTDNFHFCISWWFEMESVLFIKNLIIYYFLFYIIIWKNQTFIKSQTLNKLQDNLFFKIFDFWIYLEIYCI